MAGDSRTSTTLDLKVNARELGGLDRALKRVFSRRTPREFNTEVERVNQALKTNHRQTIKIVEAMQKVARESKAYRRLADDLKRANREGKQLEQTMQRVGRSVGGGGGGSGGGGGRSWGQGLAGGAMGAQLAMPGMGAITTALGAIPVGGALMAGSLMAAAGTYSSHVGFERARMSAQPHLGRTADLANYRAQRRVRGGGGVGRGSLYPEMNTGRLINVSPGGVGRREAIALGLQMDDQDRQIPVGAPGSGNAGYRDLVAKWRGATDPLVMGARGIADIGGNGFASQEARGRKAISDDIGRFRRGEIGRDELSPQAQTALTRVEGGTSGLVRGGQAVNTADYVSQGAQYGIAPSQALQQASGASQAARGPIGADMFGQMLAIERVTGVGTQALGGLAGNLGYTGNDMDPTKAVEEAIARGLNASEIADELQKQTGFLGQQANKGIKLDQGAFLSMNQALVGAGISGHRAGDITRQFATGAQRIGMQGPKSGVDVRMMRAMGFTGTGGPEEYAETRLQMQDPSQVLRALPAMLDDIRSGGGGRMGPNMLALTTQQILRSVGVEVGAGEAADLASGKLSIEEFMGGQLGGVQGAAKDMTPGVLQTEANIENERIAVGGRVAETMANLARTTNNMAASAAAFSPILDRMTGQMEESTGKIAAAAESLMTRLEMAGVVGESARP